MSSLLNKEQLTLALKLFLVLMLTLYVYDSQLLKMVAMSFSFYFCYSALQNKRGYLALNYLTGFIAFSLMIVTNFKSEAIILINYFFAITILMDILYWNILTCRITYFYDRREFSKAEKLALKAVEIAKFTFGKRNLNYAASLNDLAQIYHIQGKVSSAEPLYRKALLVKQSLLYSEHPEIKLSLQSFSDIYSSSEEKQNVNEDSLELFYPSNGEIKKENSTLNKTKLCTVVQDVNPVLICDYPFDELEFLFEEIKE